MPNPVSPDEMLKRALQHRRAIMAVILAMLRDPVAADDVFQDSMVAIAKSADSYDPSRDFAVWAKGVARNMVRRHWRKIGREPSHAVVEALEYLGDLAFEEVPDTWERERQALRFCMAKLKETSRRLIFLRYDRNLAGEELANASGLSPGAVGTTLARIRRQLRLCIDGRSAEVGR